MVVRTLALSRNRDRFLVLLDLQRLFAGIEVSSNKQIYLDLVGESLELDLRIVQLRVGVDELVKVDEELEPLGQARSLSMILGEWAH